MPRGIPKPKTLAHPAKGEEWREQFKSASVRVGFQVSLTRSMLEFLCAIADGVDWDRSKFGGMVAPDHFITAVRSLTKRGLIERKPDDERERIEHLVFKTNVDMHEETYWKLTPAGVYVVELVKMAGVFVKADAAISKEARQA